MPLGDPYMGACAAAGRPAPDDLVRSCCNLGYARGKCPHFPAVEDGGDAARFGIVELAGGTATIRYVIERDHHPFADGTVTLAESTQPEGTLLARQARAHLDSYLRRNT
jgi:hypothetical protein